MPLSTLQVLTPPGALPEQQHCLRCARPQCLLSAGAGAENAYLQGQAQILQQLQQLQLAMQQLQQAVQQQTQVLQQLQHRTSSARLTALLLNSIATAPHMPLMRVPHADTGADPPDCFPETVQGGWALS